jgi:RNA polymerase sigma-70 factor (ECF subfamily)
MVRRRIGSDSGVEAEDIAQEVRLKLWQVVESDRNQPLAASYIERVIVTTVIDAWRRSKATLNESIDGDEAPLAAELVEEGTQSPDSMELRRQWLAAVDACLAGLNDRRRLVLKLYLRGFSTAEMAPLLALNEDATRRLQHRALDQLKAVLRERGLEEIE